MAIELKQALRDHLGKVEHAIESTKPLLGENEYQDDPRTVVVIGFIAQVIEHHEAMMALVEEGLIGSAFTLGRPIVEGVYRGMWVNICATDAQVERFINKDEIDLTMSELAKAIDDGYHAGDFFRIFKKRSWDALNSYTHTGMLQLGRRFTEHEVKPSYTEGQIFEMTTAMTTCILLLISRFFAKCNHADLTQKVDALIETYGPLAAKKERKV